jgi:3-oxoacid CoA-transferase subunit B
VIAMDHNAKNGAHKIVGLCSPPLTGKAVVDDIVTELGWFQVSVDGLVMTEIAEGATTEEVQNARAAM